MKETLEAAADRLKEQMMKERREASAQRTKDAAKINELGNSLAKEQKLSAELQNEVKVVSDRLAKELEAIKATRAELKSVSEAKAALEKQLHELNLKYDREKADWQHKEKVLTEEKEKIRAELTAKVQAAEDAKAAALEQVKKAQKDLADAMQEAQNLHVQVTDLTLNLKEAKADAKAGWAAHSESEKQLKIEKKNVLDVKDELFKVRENATKTRTRLKGVIENAAKVQAETDKKLAKTTEELGETQQLFADAEASAKKWEMKTKEELGE